MRFRRRQCATGCARFAAATLPRRSVRKRTVQIAAMPHSGASAPVSDAFCKRYR